MRSEQEVLRYLESVVYEGRRGLRASLIRLILKALSFVYRASLAIYLFLFDTGIRKRHRLSKPVISVGNITVGGTGKTPVVQYVSRGLLSRGWKPAILSYGYGGSLHGKFGVVSNRSDILLDAKAAGDEPVMLAESLPGIPVLVCKHRDQTGKVAINDLGADAIVMDDGFQVWKFHRDFDIVLLSAENPFDNGYTLPAGKLREPVSALKRANCIIVTGSSDDSGRTKFNTVMERMRISVPVFFIDYKPAALIVLKDNAVLPVEYLQGRKVYAVSSIGNPVSFERTLASTGAISVGARRFPDHHRYNAEDAKEINMSANDSSADMIIITDKDAVKLRSYDSTVPVMVLRVEPELSDSAAFWKLLSDTTGLSEKD